MAKDTSDDEDDKFEKMDEESLGFLEQVRKGKSRNFLLSMKGNKVRSMVVKKKPIKERDRKEARGGGFQPVFGVATGTGSNITFNVARSDGFDEKTSGTKTEKLKKFLKEQTGKPFKPSIELVDTPPPIPFDDEDLNDPLIARFMKMEEEINQACDHNPDRVSEIQVAVNEIRTLLQEESTREQAGPKIDQFDKLLKEVLSGSAPTAPKSESTEPSSAPTDAPTDAPAPPPPPPAPDSEIGKLTQALKKLKPLVEKAITNHPTRKGELVTSMTQIAGEIKSNQIDLAKENMISFVALVKPLAAKPPESTSDSSSESEDPSVGFNKRLKEVIPRIKEAAGTPVGNDAKLKASEAGTFAAKKEFEQANVLLDQAEGLLDGKIQPSNKETPAPDSLDDRNVVTKWNEVRTELQPRIDKATENGTVLATKINAAWAVGIESAGKGDFDKAHKVASKLGETLDKLDKWNEVRSVLQPQIDKAAEARTEQSSKISNAWAVAIESGDQGDFDKANKVAVKLRETLKTASEQPTTESEPIGTENVSTKALLIEIRQSISGTQSNANAFGKSYPTLWSTRISSAENLVESVSDGSLEEVQEAKQKVDDILNELDPKIQELTKKKNEFDGLKTSLEGRISVLAKLNAVDKAEALKKRFQRLERDRDQATEQAEEEFKYDEAIAAIKETLESAKKLDKDADGWNKVEDIYQARKKLVDKAATEFGALGGPPQELIDGIAEIRDIWKNVKEHRQKAEYADSSTAGDRIPTLVSAFIRKAFNFDKYGGLVLRITGKLAKDRVTYGNRFDLLFPASLVEKVERYNDPGFNMTYDDTCCKELETTATHFLTVRGRAPDAVAYMDAAEELTTIRDGAMSDERIRRALKYVAPDYFDRIQTAINQGKSAANRQEYAKARESIKTGKTFSDAQQTLIGDCKLYIDLLEKVTYQLDSVRSKYSSESAQKSADAASMAIMDADNLALAKDFDSAKKRLEAIENQLKDIVTSEDLSKSLSDAREGTSGQPGSEEATKDIALVESAIKSSEESSSKAGIAFEWLPLASAKLSLAGMKRADKDNDPSTFSEEQKKALAELSTLTDQLSSYRTSRSLQTSLQEQLKKADVLFQGMSGNVLPVAVELSNQFNAIKDKLTKEIVEPLASTKQPDFAKVLDSISTLRVNIPLWQAAAEFLKPFSDAANDAETEIKQLEDTDVPLVVAANNGFDAKYKDPLDELPVEKRVQDLRRRKDDLNNKVSIANLAASTSDMKSIQAEALRFQAETVELNTAIGYVGTRLNAKAAAIKNLVDSMEQDKKDKFDELVGEIEKAAKASNASGIRIAANEVWHNVLMVDRLKKSRDGFLLTYNGLDQKLKDAGTNLDGMAKSTLIDQPVTDLKSKHVTPARNELDLLKTDGEADSKTYPAATVTVEKTKVKIAAVEKAVAGFQSIADLAAEVQKQLEDLQPVARLATFKTVVEQVEKHNDTAGQLLGTDPADFVKAKSELEAAKSLAAAAIQGMGAKSEPLSQDTTSNDTPDYEESCSKLRQQISDLKSTAGTLVVETTGMDPLESEITEIEKLISAETV